MYNLNSQEIREAAGPNAPPFSLLDGSSRHTGKPLIQANVPLDEEPEAQRGGTTGTKSHSKRRQGWTRSCHLTLRILAKLEASRARQLT